MSEHEPTEYGRRRDDRGGAGSFRGVSSIYTLLRRSRPLARTSRDRAPARGERTALSPAKE
jgi:hypothetical protein